MLSHSYVLNYIIRSSQMKRYLGDAALDQVVGGDVPELLIAVSSPLRKCGVRSEAWRSRLMSAD